MNLLPSKLFRVAREASVGRNLGKTFVQILVVWGFALVLLPLGVVWIEDRVGLARWDWDGRVALGAGLLALGSAVGLAAAWLMAVIGRGTPVPFDAARQLVVRGPYRVVRNPMAMSAVTQMLGVSSILGSPSTALLALAGGVLWNEVFRPPEEAFLAQRFGTEYRRYREAVGCWIPRWPPYPTESDR